MEARATNLRFLKLGGNRALTIALRPDEETANFVIVSIVMVGNSSSGVSVSMKEKQPLIALYSYFIS